MKVTLGKIPLEFGDHHELELQIRAPGIVRSIAYVMSQRLISRDGRPEFDEQLVAFVETSLDGPLRNYKFARLETNKTLVLKDEDGVHVEFIGTAIGPATMTETHIFQVMPMEKARS